MNGETKTSGQNPDSIRGQSLHCESPTMPYPFYSYDESKSKNLKIVTNFYDDVINSIYLVYTLYYDSPQQIIASEANNHADMNISFGKNGLEPDAYNAHYSTIENALKMSLYAKESNINQIAAKYFMIDLQGQTFLPTNLNEYEENYEKQGFVCKKQN